jgi:hypothetical protein
MTFDTSSKIFQRFKIVAVALGEYNGFTTLVGVEKWILGGRGKSRWSNNSAWMVAKHMKTR